MHPYIPYLLEDIKDAERSLVEAPEIPEPEAIEEELQQIENWASGDLNERPFGAFCGLKKEEFPPPEQLSEEDIIVVYRAFSHLLFTWNADIDLPDELPWKLRYKFMLQILEKNFTLLGSGFIVFDFCTGYAPDCIFGKYCSCKKFWEDEKDRGTTDSEKE